MLTWVEARSAGDHGAGPQEEFEHAILEDLKMLQIAPDTITWTSDWFPQILEYAEKLILAGQAYVDDTPVNQVRAS